MNNVQDAPLSRSVLFVESSLCIGCGGCQEACVMEHDLPPNTRTVKVMQIGPLDQGRNPDMFFVPVTCYHCERPACVAECPTGAMQKRPDGIVFSESQLCIGCQTCAVACPYGIPVLNPGSGKIAKCDGCRERVDQGLWPSCALKCPTGALISASALRVVQDRREREALRIARSIQTR